MAFWGMAMANINNPARAADLNSAGQVISATTSNVTALRFRFGPGLCPLDASRPVKVVLDGQELLAPAPQTERSWDVRFQKIAQKWTLAAEIPTLTKRPGLQCPIDDAFLDAFVMVRPTGQSMNATVGKWASTEMGHALEHWRKQFRGDVPVKDDTAITDEDIASRNLILWGDPQSNKVLARIAALLPISWSAEGVRDGSEVAGLRGDRCARAGEFPAPRRYPGRRFLRRAMGAIVVEAALSAPRGRAAWKR